MVDGRPVHALGMNLPVITETLTNRFISEKIAGCAILKNDAKILSIFNGIPIAGLLVFLRQTIHCELGNSRESNLSINTFAMMANGEKYQLSSVDQAKMVRAIFLAQRSKQIAAQDVVKELKDYEANQIINLKTPSDEEITMGIRHAVWPIAAIVFV